MIDAVFILRRLQEEYLDKERKLYMCFFYLEKAFDRVPRKVLEWAMRKRGINQSIPFWSGFIPVNEDGHIYPTLTVISQSNFLSPSRSIHGILTHALIFFGCPHFLLSFTSNSDAFLKMGPSSLLKTCPYHLTRCTFAIWTTVSFNPRFEGLASVYRNYIRQMLIDTVFDDLQSEPSVL